MLIAQISDLHIAQPDSIVARMGQTARGLAKAVDFLNSFQPRFDAVLCTGDLTDTGTVGEYEELLTILAPLTMPVYVVPGNHDLRENLRAAFRARGHSYLPEEGPLSYCVDVGPLRLVALDTLVEGSPSGHLDASQLRWLDAQLEQRRNAPTLIMQHHPPFASSIEMMDAMGLTNAKEEVDVLTRHVQVERVLCGHLHRAITSRVAHTLAMTCPSTTHQIQLDLRQPGGLALVSEPPAALLHVYRDQQLASHLGYIDGFPTAAVLIRPGETTITYQAETDK